MKGELKTWQIYSAIALLAALLFIPFIGAVHLFDWDEINFAESAREMISTHDYLTVRINFVPFWEKPPLFIWMQVASMKVFGINEFAARLPDALCGIVTLLVLYLTGKKLIGHRFGLLWVMLYAGSIFPFFYFKTGIIDPWFNLFIFLGIYQIYLYFNSQSAQLRHAIWSGLFIGLAVLTKGPVAFLVFSLTTFIILLIRRFRVNIRITDVLAFLIVLGITGGFWFILQILTGNFNIIADFITYQIRLFKTKDAGHGGFLFYHFVVLFFGVFPASLFALPSVIKFKKGDANLPPFHTWMLVLFWVVLILFTIVKTKIVHYSSLCYFPLTFMAAWTVYHVSALSDSWKKWISNLIVAIGIAWTVIVILLSFIDLYKNLLVKIIDDPFAVECLKADGGWMGIEWLCGIILLIGLILFKRYWKQNRIERATYALTFATAVFMFSAMTLIVPRVEAYSQRSAIEFFKSVSSEDVYLQTIGYKSYAHLFYGKAKEQSVKDPEKEWLLKGPIDKTAYFSVKTTRKKKFMDDYPKIEFLYERNGFAFFRRMPEINNAGKPAIN